MCREIHELLGANGKMLLTSIDTNEHEMSMKHTCGIISIALKDKLVHTC